MTTIFFRGASPQVDPCTAGRSFIFAGNYKCLAWASAVFFSNAACMSSIRFCTSVVLLVVAHLHDTQSLLGVLEPRVVPAHLVRHLRQEGLRPVSCRLAWGPRIAIIMSVFGCSR